MRIWYNNYSYILHGDRSKTNYFVTKDCPLYSERNIRILILRAFVSGRTALAGRRDEPERSSIIIFFFPVRQVCSYIRDGPCQKQQPTWFTARHTLVALPKGGNKEGFRRDPLWSSIMRPLFSVLSSILRVYTAYIMYRVSA